MSIPYREIFSGATTYVGLDFAATEHGLSKPDVVFDGEAIPFPDDSFDAVVLFEVLDDLANPYEQLREIQRVLKPGGTLLLTTTFVWELHEEPHDIARYTHYGVKNILERSGFGEAQVDRLGRYQRVIGQAQAMYWYQTMQKFPRCCGRCRHRRSNPGGYTGTRKPCS